MPNLTADRPKPFDSVSSQACAGKSAGRSPFAVEARGLRKSFGEHVVLDGIDLSVREGSIFALLGPNGSGKTTTIQILSTLLQPDAGTVRVAGHDVCSRPDAVRRSIGVTGQFSAVDQLLTGRENLRLMADLAHLGRGRAAQLTGELLDRFDLTSAADRMAATYSGGMVRRLDLAMTLVGAPRVIFLDEPTTGLDPRSRRTMWEVIEGLVAGGTTVMLTTQQLDEADRLADRIALLDGGRIVAEGTPSQLKQLVPGSHIELYFSDARAFESASRVLGEAKGERDAESRSIVVPTDGSASSIRDLFTRLDDSHVDVERIAVHTADLNDVFFSLTGDAPERGIPTTTVREGQG